jgi:7-cyano-7-deazaguanine synthase
MTNTSSQPNRNSIPASNPTVKEVIVTSKPIEKVLVVLSGGQDSTTCLFWAIAKFGHGNVEALSFFYGQRHRVELDCAATIAKMAGVKHTILPINTFTALGGALVGNGDVNGKDATNPALPASYIAGRNLAFLVFASAYGYQRGIHHLVTGTSQTDFSGYPDCRRTTLDALEKTLQLGMEWEIHIHTPLMFISKAETVNLAIELGAMESLAQSHTCYNGKVPPCMECPACKLRAKGFEEAGIEDPLITRTMRGQQ